MLARVPLGSDRWFVEQVRTVRTRGRVLLVRRHTTLLAAVARIDPGTADLRAVTLIRREPQPVAVVVDLRSMILTGDTTYNLAVRPGDMLSFP